jgi:hypothetical protein
LVQGVGVSNLWCVVLYFAADLVISLTDNALLTLITNDEHPLLPKVERLSIQLTKRLFDLYSRQILRRFNIPVPMNMGEKFNEEKHDQLQEFTVRTQALPQNYEEDDEYEEESSGRGGYRYEKRDDESNEQQNDAVCDIGIVHSSVQWSEIAKGVLFVVGRQPRKHWLPLLDRTVGRFGLVIESDMRTRDVLLRIFEPHSGACEQWWYHYTDLRRVCDSCGLFPIKDLISPTKSKDLKELSKDNKELFSTFRSLHLSPFYILF